MSPNAGDPLSADTPPLHLPPPQAPEHLLLFARWIGWRETKRGAACRRLKHAYSLAIRPEEPIATGRLVRILATSPHAYHAPNSPPEHMDTYDPHVVGEIVEVWETCNYEGRARIRNRCRGNDVEEVELEFPYRLATTERTWGHGPGRGTEAELVLLALGLTSCIRPARVDNECRGSDCGLAKTARTPSLITTRRLTCPRFRID